MLRLPSSITSTVGKIGQRAQNTIRPVVKEGPGVSVRKGIGSGYLSVSKPSLSAKINVQAVSGRVAKADSVIQNRALPGVSSIQGQVKKNDKIYEGLLRRRQIVDKSRGFSSTSDKINKAAIAGGAMLAAGSGLLTYKKILRPKINKKIVQAYRARMKSGKNELSGWTQSLRNMEGDSYMYLKTKARVIDKKTSGEFNKMLKSVDQIGESGRHGGYVRKKLINVHDHSGKFRDNINRNSGVLLVNTGRGLRSRYDYKSAPRVARQLVKANIKDAQKDISAFRGMGKYGGRRESVDEIIKNGPGNPGLAFWKHLRKFTKGN